MLLILMLALPVVATAQPVIFDVNTNHPGDTIYLGNPAEIVFYVDAGPHELGVISFPQQATYTNGLSFDSLTWGDNFHFSPYAASVFAILYLSPTYADVETPDTIWFDGISFGDPWIGVFLEL